MAWPQTPPSVAPRKSEGEKMPPDAPEPMVTHVDSSLQTKSSAPGGEEGGQEQRVTTRVLIL